VEGSRGSGAGGTRALVLAEGGLAVGPRADLQLLLGGLGVLPLATPRLQNGLLESAAVGEGECPRLLGIDGIDGVERERCVLLRHTARKESNAGDRGRDSVLKDTDSGAGNVLVGAGLGSRRGLTSTDHVGLEEGALKENVVLREGGVLGCKHSLGDGRGDLDGVGAVHEDLRLDDGDEAVHLADGGVAGEAMDVLVNGQLGGGTAFLDVDDRAPADKKQQQITIINGGRLQRQSLLTTTKLTTWRT
jgi:hypothetical protein